MSIHLNSDPQQKWHRENFGSVAERRTTYVYDDKGNVVTVISPKPSSVLVLDKPTAYDGRRLDAAHSSGQVPSMKADRRSYCYGEPRGGSLCNPALTSLPLCAMTYDAKGVG
jgi:hypothetical protein